MATELEAARTLRRQIAAYAGFLGCAAKCALLIGSSTIDVESARKAYVLRQACGAFTLDAAVFGARRQSLGLATPQVLGAIG